MKKILLVVIGFVLLITITGCANKTENTQSSNSRIQSSENVTEYSPDGWITVITPVSQDVYRDKEAHSAKCVLDNPEFIEKLRLFDTLNREGLLTSRDTALNTSAETLFISEAHSFKYGYPEPFVYDFYGKSVKVIPIFGKTETLRSHPNMVTGICKGNERGYENYGKFQTPIRR